jgi:formylglycine-generating enzyme required for sulfatase activity
MHGNVAEWCADTFRRDYEALPGVDPLFDPPDTESRMLRGGMWDLTAEDCRAAARDWGEGTADSAVGLRVCWQPG